eukprot:Pgem_evm2s8543
MIENDLESGKRTAEEIDATSKSYKRETNTLPIGVTSIEVLLNSNYYSDKTGHAGQLLTERKPSFLIRPRRFGKSSFIDTLATIAEGVAKKEVFKGTFIYDGIFKNEHGVEQKYQWKKYPVIRLDFSGVCNESAKILEIDIKKALFNIANNYGLAKEMKPPEGDDSLKSYFISLFNKLKKLGGDYESKVVVLIDEYDSPIVNLEWGSELHKKNKEILMDFFTEVKTCSNDIQLEFVTGVTKFSLSGLCSGANNLDDISMDEAFSDIVGYQEEEIQELFKDRFNTISDTWKRRKKENYTQEDIMDTIKSYYNGYQFSQEGKGIYNPASVLSFFKEGNPEGYWYSKGDPTLLINQMKGNLNRFNIDWDQQVFKATKSQLMVTKDNKEINLIPLMYQTGYLTLDGTYDNTTEEFGLKFPNKEIKIALADNLETLINEQEKEDGRKASTDIKSALDKKDWIRFLKIIQKKCFASSNYEFIKNEEKSFQGLLASFLQGAFTSYRNIDVRTEEQTGNGRSDIIIDDKSGDDRITYVIELKRNETAQKAIDQIQQRGYHTKYDDATTLVLVGLNCLYDATTNRNKRDPNHRNINECTILISTKEDSYDDHEFAGSPLHFKVENRNFVKK